MEEIIIGSDHWRPPRGVVGGLVGKDALGRSLLVVAWEPAPGEDSSPDLVRIASGHLSHLRIANGHLSHLLFQRAGDDRVQIVAERKRGWLDAEWLDGRVLSGVAK